MPRNKFSTTLARSPNVVSEAAAEKSVASSGLRRSLLIGRLEESRSRARRTRGPMGFESSLVSRPLPDANFGQNPVIDTHRYTFRNLRHLQGAPATSVSKAQRFAYCAHVRQRNKVFMVHLTRYDYRATGDFHLLCPPRRDGAGSATPPGSHPGGL